MTSSQLRTATAAASDVGRKRSGNEDSYALWASDDLGRDHVVETLLVVADGMGGSNAGEVASRMAVEAVVRTVSEAGEGDAAALLAAAVEAANHEVHEHSRSRADLQGMGTTCTVVALKGDACAYAHVGDSRAYLIREGHIRQITHDHSLVAQLVARKQLTPEEARHDPRRNVVTRSVGVGPVVEVDSGFLGEPLEPGDTLLLCSDGLHGQVTDSEIAEIASGESLDRACRELIALANQNGGPDNITVAMARLESPDPPIRRPARAVATASSPGRAAKPAEKPRPTGSRRTLQLIIAALVALLLALSGLAWMVFGMMRGSQAEQSSRNQRAGAGEFVAWR